jgi:hypothetical protein
LWYNLVYSKATHNNYFLNETQPNKNQMIKTKNSLSGSYLHGAVQGERERERERERGERERERERER